MPPGGHTRCDLAVPRGSQGLLLILGLVMAVLLTWEAGREGGSVRVRLGLVGAWGGGLGVGGARG